MEDAVPMWFDERGSEVLTLPECQRLVALAFQENIHGHLGLCGQGAPIVLPVDFTVDGPDVVLLVGEGLFMEIAEHHLVALQIDGEDAGQRWSVLIRGYATEIDALPPDVPSPVPHVAQPGHRLVRIRSDIETGRRLSARASEQKGLAVGDAGGGR
ncbi:MAG: pyridoxamine 5'-phosphate oxidase family protein [Actinomycetota bacterium]|nr:pyridoxamine 5'-phosphate oxidase family protein [Actinomycetota bacterium]